MQVPEGFHRVVNGSGLALLRADLADLPVAEFWVEGGELAGAKGRGGVSRSRLSNGLHVVFRDYRRGGVIGWLLRSCFFDPSRPQRELEILARLRRAGVAAVEPLAALSKQRLLGYRLRLATELFADALPLPAFLAAHPRLRAPALRAAGRLVASAFAQGLWHRDLHPDNILARAGADGPELRLLDLDRAELRSDLGEADQDRMLVRMARYLLRHAEGLPVKPAATDYLRFLAGMGMDRSARRQTMARLLPRYRGEVAWHRLAWWRQPG